MPNPILMALDVHSTPGQQEGPHLQEDGRRKGNRDPGPCLGGNENKLEPSKTELEDPLDPQVTALAVSPPAFCISAPEIHTPRNMVLTFNPSLGLGLRLGEQPQPRHNP